MCQATVDKEGSVRPLAKALERVGAETWLDESRLHVGDGLRRGIEDGVRLCNYAVAVLSPAFFASEWAQRERRLGLIA